MTVEAVLILAAVAGALAFVIAYPVVADPRYWTREGWNWWLVSLGLVLLGGSELADSIWGVPQPWETYADRTVITLFVALTWHRVYLLARARREARRERSDRG